MQAENLNNPQTSHTQPQTLPLVIGAPLGKNLSVVEAARRLVSQWEAIHESTLSSNPEAAGPILEELNQTRAQLDALTAQQHGEDTHNLLLDDPYQDPALTPLNSLQAHKEEAIASRINFLTDSLPDSSFPPEHANITAAISLYRASRIPYSANWALIYAGHLVDFAPNYVSFTADRDAGAAPSPFFSARKSTFLPETDSAYDMGHYSVTMSFRRMKSLAYCGAEPLLRSMSMSKKRKCENRDDEEEAAMLSLKDWPTSIAEDVSDEEYDDADTASDSDLPGFPPRCPRNLRKNRPSRHPHMARDSSAPTLHFRTLLDSGSTLPMLYNRDARALGIHRASYAAVSRIAVETASDKMAIWLYEMEVAVVDTATCEPLVSASSPVWPAEELMLGGITLVMVRNSPKAGSDSFSSPGGGTDAIAKTTAEGKTTFLEKATSLIDIAEGRDYGRLSGLLPFKVCYMQSTPGLRTIWMGEDRRDVLGAHRMPGQMRWAPGTGTVCDPGHPRETWKTACGDDDGRPALLHMAHEEAVSGYGEQRASLVDVEEKRWKGRSEVTVTDKNG
ncbi:hypothetical protein BDP55DRAFT_588366, partial [Colletotrichum godetiae]